MCFLGGASGKEHIFRCRRQKRRVFDPWLGIYPRVGNGNPGESQGQKSLAGYSPWSHKGLDMTEVTWHAHI